MMKRLFQGVTAGLITLSFSAAWAAPNFLITHNRTNVESNAYIDGRPSPHPTKASSDGRVHWSVVRMACYNHKPLCPAMIKMETNTAKPVNLGIVSLNVETGDITPKYLSANGYVLTVNGPGEATLTKN